MTSTSWPAGLELRYDRRVSPEFLAVFGDGGVLNTLVEYARLAPYPVDLQFRRDLKTDAQRATLYVGLEKVLDVHRDRRGHIRLVGHKVRAAEHGFLVEWGVWMPHEQVLAALAALELYLDRVIPPTAASSAGVEGAVQAAISSYDSTERTMLDREFILQFPDTDTRRRVLGEVSADLVALAASAPIPGQPPTGFGGEFDLVAVDAAGRLLAVEVKPRGANNIPWAPLQVIVYARLLRRWMETDPDAPGILNGVAAQRKALGLLAEDAPVITPDAEVVPFLAIQRGMSPTSRNRLAAMLSYLSEQGVIEAESLEVYEASVAGRLIPIA